MKHVSIKYAIQDAMEEMGVDDNSRLFPKFHRWGKEADQAIAGFKNYVPCVKLIQIQGDTIPMPEEAIAVYPGVFVSNDFQIPDDVTMDLFELHATLGNRIASIGARSGAMFSIDITSHPCNVLWLHYKIIDGNLRIYSKEWDGQTAVVPYLGYPTDEEGYIRVNPINQRAIREYIKWQHSKNTRFGAREKRMEYSDIDRFEKEYHRLVRYARGEQAEPDTLEKDRIAVMHNSPYSGSIDFYWINEPNSYYTLIY